MVITGVGLVTPLEPLAPVDKFWSSLCSGNNGIKKKSPPLLDFGREWLMASIDLPESYNSLAPENKFIFFAEEAILMAMNDAAIRGHKDVGLCIGTVLGNMLFKEKQLMQGKDHDAKDADNGSSLSFITSYLAGKHCLTPAFTVSTACASGTDAIGIAARRILTGKADIMIAGGVDVLSDFSIAGFHVLQALTSDKVRPFDKNRSGLAVGEGAAFVVLESKSHATLRGARIYARVMGYASRSDANHLTGPHKEGRGLADAISKALLDAGIKPHEIGYINAHGTGTVYNDLMETKAIKKALGAEAYSVPISSTKSMLGHSFGAAGAIEVICCILSIINGVIPPTINFSEKDPECDLDYVPNIPRQSKINFAMSLSAGFGGQNSAIILGNT